MGYGANYYCYLFAQSLSAALWQRGQASPSGHGTWPDGDLLRRQLLEPGGAKGAFHYVSDVFGGRGEGVLNEADGGGWYPDVDGLLEHLHLR